MKFYYKLPLRARTRLGYDFTGNLMTVSVLALEVKNDTKMGKKILEDLGFKEEE